MTTSSHSVTHLLLAWRQGGAAALDQLVPIVYQHLRRLARRYMSAQKPAHTLRATGPVNEALRPPRGLPAGGLEGPLAHSFAISAQVMRRILIDVARARCYQKRGGGARKTSLDEGLLLRPEVANSAKAITGPSPRAWGKLGSLPRGRNCSC